MAIVQCLPYPLTHTVETHTIAQDRFAIELSLTQLPGIPELVDLLFPIHGIFLSTSLLLCIALSPHTILGCPFIGNPKQS